MLNLKFCLRDIANKIREIMVALDSKPTITLVWENPAPNTKFESKEIPYDVSSDCDGIAILVKLKTGTDREAISESMCYFTARGNGDLSITGNLAGRRGTAYRLAIYGANTVTRYTISSGTYFNDLVNTNDNDVCIPLKMYEIRVKTDK